MHWSDTQEVIKAKDILFTDLAEKAPVRLVPSRYHMPINEIECNTAENIDNDADKLEEIRQAMEAQLKAAEKDAYQKGFLKGVQEGIVRGKEELSMATKTVVKLTRELEILHINFLKNNEKTMLDLAFAIAAKVIHREVSTDRKLVCSVLEDALRDMQDRQGARILMNPKDYRCITEASPSFIDRYGDIRFERDEKIKPGGAIIEMPTGQVDARLDKQLEKIREALYDEYGH